ncbi:MAG TPA: serine hydrolase [Usitatibacter sp.]|nr:serine hydrolase [Usitatibacter sp.]
MAHTAAHRTTDCSHIVGDRAGRGQRLRLAHWAAWLLALSLTSGCTAVRTVVHNLADLDDHRIFANRTVANGARASTLRTVSRTPAYLSRLQLGQDSGTISLEGYLDGTGTAAFLVLHEDRVVYERYARGYDERSLLNSFSIAKAVMGTLVGIAIADGRIRGLDATVAEYRPDLASTAYAGVTVRQLLAMTSGLGDRPSMLPGRSQYYYGDDLLDVLAGARPEARPANQWRYSEADIQVLGLVLAAAVGKTISEYLAEKLWQPLGMESPALWALDREGGTEKAFCCISARARDFARLGRLWLDEGRWDGKSIVNAGWMREGVPGVRTPDGYTHRNLFWLPEGGHGDFYAYGHNGQYLYVNPAARVVIVKFSETARQDPLPVFRSIAEAIATPERIAEIDRLASDFFASR